MSKLLETISLDVPTLPVKAVFALVGEETIADGSRTYAFSDPDGYEFSCPSVTTVLSKTADNGWLEEWRERVGAEKADKISHLAKSRGTSMHSVLERLAKGEKIRKSSILPNCVGQALAIHKELQANLTAIYAIEPPVVSPLLRVAGRTDLIGRWNDKPSIIDYKTSKRIKTKQDITDYFLQACIYALLVEETLFERHIKYGKEVLTPLVPEQIVILMACDTGDLLVFVDSVARYKKDAQKRIDTYWREVNENQKP